MKMDGTRTLATRILLRFFAALLCIIPVTSSAGILPKSLIPLGKEIVLTIGLPNDYDAIYGQDPNRRKHCTTLSRSSTRLCARYVYGNDFQLLDWLENGRIDGAMVAPLSLKILHTNKRLAFNDHFFVARQDAFTNRSPASYHLGLRAYVNGSLQSKPYARFETYLESLLDEHNEPAIRITLGSQLSPAFAALLQITDAWLQEHGASAAQQAQLWQRLLQHTDFILSRPLPDNASTFTLVKTSNCNSATVYCLGETLAHDRLLLRRQVIPDEEAPTLLPAFAALHDNNPADDIDEIALAIRASYEGIVPAYLPIPPAGDTLAAPLQKFIVQNYTPHQVGSQVRRYFRFTITELMHLLHPARKNTDKDGIALVLTGGGVKAAYQTKLVDYLYTEPYLANIGVKHSPGHNPDPLEVKYVIGTSGGALLGMFVAAINQGGNPNFSDLLWINDKTGQLISFTDAFPPIDMLRWLSFLFSLFLFSALAILLYRVRCVREYLGIDTPQGAGTLRDTGGRFLRFSIVWVGFLALAPYLIRYVNGPQLSEHIPEMQGFFYFIFSLIAIHTDNHIVRATREAEDRATVQRPAILWVLLACGVLLTLLPLMHRKWGLLDGVPGIDTPWQWLDELLRWKMTTVAFLFCIGLLLLARFVQRWYFEHSSGFRPLRASEGDVRGSYQLLMLVPLLSAAGVYVLYRFDLVSPLELTISFWVGLLCVSLAVGLVIFAYTLLERHRDTLHQWVLPRLRFLMSRHPSNWELHMNRHTRILIMFGFAWGWWNIVIGPGMYGNNVPQEYINNLYDKVASQQRNNASTPAAGMQGFSLQTYFVAPATSLENKSERYFLFEPHNSGTNRKGSVLGHENQLAIASDPRWTQFQPGEQKKETLTQIAFASGSPFPVFPAHKVTLDGTSEMLVDGGYAHNTPIEAAKTLGADRLLVIYSSPLNPGGDETPAVTQQLFGTMAENLPRLVPYLYERSQIEDILSAEELLVAALSPTGGDDPDSWPLLTDFRQSVVQRMLDEAKRDLDKRIGTIQNWGLPEK